MENSNKKNKILDFVQKVEDRANDTLNDSLLDEDAKGENFNVSSSDIVKNSTKAKLSKIPWLIAIFLILIISLMIGTMFFKNNPKTLFTQTIDGMFSYLENNFNDSAYDITDGNISLNYNLITDKENNQLNEDLNHIKWNIDYVLDSASNKAYIDLKTKYDDDNLLNLNVYSDDINTYIYIPSLYNKYIKTKTEKKVGFATSHDIRVILDGFNQAIDKVINNEKIYNAKEDIQIDNKNIKAYKTKLIVSKQNRDRVSATFINTLKANDEFVESLAKLKRQTTSEITEKLDKYLTKLNKKLKTLGTLDVSLYTNRKTKDFLKVTFAAKNKNASLIRLAQDKFSYELNKEDQQESGEFSLKVNDNKTKYIINTTYKKVENGNTVFEDNCNLKLTNKKANSFKKIDTTSSVTQDQISDLEKAQIYMNVVNNQKLNSIISKYIKTFENWYKIISFLSFLDHKSIS